MNQYLMNQVTDWLSKPENQAKMAQTWPGKMVQSAVHAAALPGEVYAGKTDPMSEDSIQRAFELAGNVTGSAFAKGVTPNAVGIGPTKLKAAVPETQGIRAYHGSPHDFEKFDLSKIGTGEGAQSYGHGLYFAENPAVARQYRDTLSNETLLTPKGEVFDPMTLEHLNVRATMTREKDLEAAINRALGILPNANEQVRPMVERDLQRLLKIREEGGLQPHVGKMYEVDLRAKPEQFLDWDRPIMQQPKTVQELAESILRNPGRGKGFVEDAFNPKFPASGGNLYNAITHKFEKNAPQATAMLQEAGVPGIRYLDQGSRKTPDDLKIDLARATIKGDQEAIRQIQQQIKQSQQTSNYVVFDPSIINILRKYNAGGAVANAMRFVNG